MLFREIRRGRESSLLIEVYFAIRFVICSRYHVFLLDDLVQYTFPLYVDRPFSVQYLFPGGVLKPNDSLAKRQFSIVFRVF